MLRVEDVTVRYEMEDRTIYAVHDATFQLNAGEILGIVGESGSGKTSLINTIIRQHPDHAHVDTTAIEFNDGRRSLRVDSCSEGELISILWDGISFIPQNAMGCLDPIRTIESQIRGVIHQHTNWSDETATERIESVMRMVDLDIDRVDAYPHELSGGMKQRAIVAMAAVLEPAIIIADEPTTGLDVVTKNIILDDIRHLADDLGTSFIIISHDITDMLGLCDRIAVMYGGKIVEVKDVNTLVEAPEHPYTMSLLSSVPNLDMSIDELMPTDLSPPENTAPPDRCIYLDNCPFADDTCETEHPPLVGEKGNAAACFHQSRSDDMRRSIYAHEQS